MDQSQYAAPDARTLRSPTSAEPVVDLRILVAT